MIQFASDAEKEAAIGTFLDAYLYDRIAADFDRQTDAAVQQAGIDVEVTLAEGDGPVAVDEKAQTDYVNSPAPTFVLEIFGETFERDGGLETSTGWFVDEGVETEYYLFVWPTHVSVFRLETVSAAEDPVLVYRPADLDAFARRWRESPELQELLTRKADDEYRTWWTEANVQQFEAHVETLPDALGTAADPTVGGEVFDAANIAELTAVLVTKGRLRDALTRHRLDPETLRTEGERVARTERSEDVSNDLGRMKIAYSDRNGENPVNLVVWYDVYHELAEETFTVHPEELVRGERLF